MSRMAMLFRWLPWYRVEAAYEVEAADRAAALLAHRLRAEQAESARRIRVLEALVKATEEARKL